MSESDTSARSSSNPTERIRLPLVVPVLPYLRDHHYDGKIMLPAVEIMQRLAGSVQSYLPDVPVLRMHSASFERFLNIQDDCHDIEAINELEIYENGRISSSLLTISPIKGTSITRTKVHAVVNFGGIEGNIIDPPMDVISALEGICQRITPQELYQDLVPFGPSYQNVKGDVYLSTGGAIAHVSGPDHPAPAVPLGSPFPLDGALHVACAWGQRYHNIIAFPVGFAKRSIIRPAVVGHLYTCRILPRSCIGGSLQFDIWIVDSAGDLCEEIRGLIMRDVSGGRLTPHQWIRWDGRDSLASIRKQCMAVSVIEDSTVTAFAVRALSEDERMRYHKMGRKRQNDYLAARLALKHLSRKLAGDDLVTPAPEISTLMPDNIHPRCHVPGGVDPEYCSVSHDSRFAVAVAGNKEIGVDVEYVSDRVLKARHCYMSKEEMALTEESTLGSMHASIRIWSIKEGVAKATGKPLAESWSSAEVKEVGLSRSYLTVDGARYAAFHDDVDNHIFTLVKREY
jgi:phosphopantetheinyl transferase